MMGLMEFKSILTEKVTAKKVLYRAPFDIAVHEEKGEYQLNDLSRIEACLPTLRFLLSQKCQVVILTYVGRPEGKVVASLRTNPHALALEKMLAVKVTKLDDCVGDTVTAYLKQQGEKEVVMLENTRFHPEEMVDDDNFAKELAKNGELVVFDAFPQAHRAHASVTGIMRHLPSLAGYYFLREVKALSSLFEVVAHPLVIVIGGVKLSEKIGVIENLHTQVDYFLLGGGVANIFLQAKGIEVADSIREEKNVTTVGSVDWLRKAQELLSTEAKIVLPTDVVVKTATHQQQLLPTDRNIPAGGKIVDIGAETVKNYQQLLKGAATIFWNGPLGLIEEPPFDQGSRQIAQIIEQVAGTTIVAGGDTIGLVNKEKVSHVSLAGGATLEFLSGKKLPAVEMLKLNHSSYPKE